MSYRDFVHSMSSVASLTCTHLLLTALFLPSFANSARMMLPVSCSNVSEIKFLLQLYTLVGVHQSKHTRKSKEYLYILLKLGIYSKFLNTPEKILAFLCFVGNENKIFVFRVIYSERTKLTLLKSSKCKIFSH